MARGVDRPDERNVPVAIGLPARFDGLGVGLLQTEEFGSSPPRDPLFVSGFFFALIHVEGHVAAFRDGQRFALKTNHFQKPRFGIEINFEVFPVRKRDGFRVHLAAQNEQNGQKKKEWGTNFHLSLQ